MCGIVGAIAQREISDILINGLYRLEYRGYDSAGVAIVDPEQQLQIIRRVGKVKELDQGLKDSSATGHIGIAHTRWATHGEPSEINAHPHSSGDIAVVHNGIIENHQELKDQLEKLGYIFVSQTDTEVIAHLLSKEFLVTNDLLQAVKATVKQLKGAYGMVALHSKYPDQLVAARSGSPLVIGLGEGENFLASDQLALLNVTRSFIFLEEGDIAQITKDKVAIYDAQSQLVAREVHKSTIEKDEVEKGQFGHYMQKEIYDQPNSIINTLAGRISNDQVLLDSFDKSALDILSKVEHVQIVACGTSYNSGLLARYWFESLIGVSCDVEIASEFRYRKFVTRPNSLVITLSQSGETADTLAALRIAKEKSFMATMAICNVDGSSLVRESDIAFLTKAGTEICVASTKAFTTQLVSLLLLVTTIGKLQHKITATVEAEIVGALNSLPNYIEKSLQFDSQIEQLSQDFLDKKHCLFLGRGEYYPIAMEASLKLKEISYIHAEAYAAGELKHGPLALIDNDMPVVVIAPTNDLLEKVKSNIEEVRARGGQIYVFTDQQAGFTAAENFKVIEMPKVNNLIAPIYYSVAMQLLAYRVALLKGTDVDQPRNLAKAVTVE